MVSVSPNFTKSLNALKDPEIAKDWEEFISFVKSFRSHMFLGSIAVAGAGIFTMVYGLAYMQNNKHLIPIEIAGLVTTILGVGMTVDMGSHLYYG